MRWIVKREDSGPRLQLIGTDAYSSLANATPDCELFFPLEANSLVSAKSIALRLPVPGRLLSGSGVSIDCGQRTEETTGAKEGSCQDQASDQ